MKKMNKNLLADNGLLNNKKLMAILIVVVGFALFFSPKHYPLLAPVALYFGLKLANKAFLEQFSAKKSHILYKPDSKIRKIKIVFAMPVALVLFYIVMSNPEPVYRAIAVIVIIPFLLLYNLVDRYKMVSAAGNMAKTDAFFRKKLKHSKRLMIAGFLIGFVPVVNFFGLVFLIVGIVQYFTVKILYFGSNKFEYVHPAYVHSKYNYEN